MPGLFMDGMFADGTQYACVSKHLAEGKGTFWFPFLSETWNKQGANYFLEQPPLMYALQAPFFAVLGDGMYTERIYILLTLCITAFLVVRTWQYIAPAPFRKYGWLPLLFWISIPLMSWTYRQNMQENTMVIFTTASIYFGVRSIHEPRRNVLYAVLTGVFIFLASFTKGIPGFFPLVTAFMAFLSTREIKFTRMVFLSAIYLLVPVVVYTLLFISGENAASSLEFYVRSRLLQRVASAPVVDSHFYMLGRLATELLPAIALLLLLYIGRGKSVSGRFLHRKTGRKALFFFLLGLSGALPLMITLVQRGFYMSISFPAFGLAFALLAVPHVDKLAARIPGGRVPVLNSVTAVMVLSGIVLTILLAGKPGRSRELLADVYVLGEILAPEQRISCDGASYHNWPFQFYMLRYNEVYLEKSNRTLSYYIVEKGGSPHVPERYEKVSTRTVRYDLYLKKDAGP
jgi:4-amino-4-deoxy-L-arabinose transferase-like glycosyltransferase